MHWTLRGWRPGSPPLPVPYQWRDLGQASSLQSREVVRSGSLLEVEELFNCQVLPSGRWSEGLGLRPSSVTSAGHAECSRGQAGIRAAGQVLLFCLPSQTSTWAEACVSLELDPGPGQDTGLDPAEASTGKYYPPEKGYHNGKTGLILLRSESTVREEPISLHTAGPPWGAPELTAQWCSPACVVGATLDRWPTLFPCGSGGCTQRPGDASQAHLLELLGSALGQCPLPCS